MYIRYAGGQSTLYAQPASFVLDFDYTHALMAHPRSEIRSGVLLSIKFQQRFENVAIFVSNNKIILI